MDNLLKKDQKYVWHPYTQMKDQKTYPPLVITSAKGVKIYDNQGRFYYDTISSWWCNVHGHCNRRISNAIKNQLRKMDHVMFSGITHEPAVMLAERLINIAPKTLKKVFFSDNGSSAVEVALKMSFQYWQMKGLEKKYKFICLDLGYHGDTIGTMSVGGIDLYNKIFRPLFYKTYRAPSPYCYRCPLGKIRKNCSLECADRAVKIMKDNAKKIAAFIIEPMLIGAGGIIVYPPEYLNKIGEAAKKYNVHLIFDEVATGFGRTGRMFASEYADVQPDLMCVSKGITSGTLPLAATLASEDIYSAFYGEYKDKKTFYHGHTYTGNPVSCAAAVESLKIFEEEKTLLKAKRIAKKFHSELLKFNTFQNVGDVRFLGHVGALEIVKNKKTKEMFSFKERKGHVIYRLGLKNNLFLRPLGNITYFFLPLSLEESELMDIMKRAYAVLSEFSSRDPRLNEL